MLLSDITPPSNVILYIVPYTCRRVMSKDFLLLLLILNLVTGTSIMSKFNDCDSPDYVVNGALEISSVKNDQRKFHNGTYVKYSCRQGYKLEPPESEVRYCINGSWTNLNPSCSK